MVALVACETLLLAFLSTGCSACTGFWDALRERGRPRQLPSGIRFVAIVKGADEYPDGADR